MSVAGGVEQNQVQQYAANNTQGVPHTSVPRSAQRNVPIDYGTHLRYSWDFHYFCHGLAAGILYGGKYELLYLRGMIHGCSAGIRKKKDGDNYLMPIIMGSIGGIAGALIGYSKPLLVRIIIGICVTVYASR